MTCRYRSLHSSGPMSSHIAELIRETRPDSSRIGISDISTSSAARGDIVHTVRTTPITDAADEPSESTCGYLCGS